jgi:hypothetical protein
MAGCLSAPMFPTRQTEAERSDHMTDQILPRRTALPTFLIATRPRRRRLRWANLGFAAAALLLLSLAILSILYVGPAPISGPAAPPLQSHTKLLPG